MYSNFIKHIQNYITLNENEIQILTEQLQPVQFKKKEFLLKEGQVCKCNYFVIKGCLRLFYINEKGTEHITQFAIENWWIADYMSFDRQLPSSFYIQAVENSEVVCLDSAVLEELLKKIPKLERYLRVVLQKAHAAMQYKIRFMSELTKEESYQHFVTHFPGFLQRIPQYMLASYLGFTPEYLSELRKKRS